MKNFSWINEILGFRECVLIHLPLRQISYFARDVFLVAGLLFPVSFFSVQFSSSANALVGNGCADCAVLASRVPWDMIVCHSSFADDGWNGRFRKWLADCLTFNLTLFLHELIVILNESPLNVFPFIRNFLSSTYFFLNFSPEYNCE